MGNKKLTEWIAQAAAGAVNNGVWVDVTSMKRVTIDILISNTATAQIMGSCAPAKPADATDGRKIGADITTSSLIEITAKLKWIKVKVFAWTSGTVDAYGIGESTAYGV